MVAARDASVGKVLADAVLGRRSKVAVSCNCCTRSKDEKQMSHTIAQWVTTVQVMCGGPIHWTSSGREGPRSRLHQIANEADDSSVAVRLPLIVLPRRPSCVFPFASSHGAQQARRGDHGLLQRLFMIPPNSLFTELIRSFSTESIHSLHAAELMTRLATLSSSTLLSMCLFW